MDNKILSARDRVASEVIAEIINGLNSGKMSLEEAQGAARLTLDTLNRIEKHEDTVIEFYKQLSGKYELFKILYTKIRDEIMRSREIVAWKNALEAIDSGRIEEAKDIVDMAIDQTANETTELTKK